MLFNFPENLLGDQHLSSSYCPTRCARLVALERRALVLKNFSLDFPDHDELTGVEVGPEAAKRIMEEAYKRWPDLHVAVEDILAEGDKVMVRNSWTATESSGQKIELHGFVVAFRQP